MKLSTTYNVLLGDTFEIIARRRYGTELGAEHIRSANPGASEPLFAGTTIIIPAVPGTPTDRISDTPAAGSSEVAVFVGTEHFRFWDQVVIVRSVDAFDSAAFSAPFDVDTPGFKEVFRPFSFQPFGIDVGGRRLFSGTLMSVNPEVTSEGKIITANGYSAPGVLGDCTAPSSVFDGGLGFYGQNLREIATTLATPFGISVVFDTDPGPSWALNPPVLKPGKKLLPFLAGLAKQRGLLITNTPEGELFFRKADVGAGSVATLRQGGSPSVSITPTFNPHEYYSHITAKQPMYFGLGGDDIVAVNPQLQGVLRPLTYNAADGVYGADVQRAVDSKMGRMFANAAPYTAKLASWYTPDGALWAPGDTVTVHAPDAMIYKPYDFVIRQVTLTRTASEEAATLALVLPGSLAGKAPKEMPWDG